MNFFVINVLYLDKRQACAIESAIKTQMKGPTRNILVVVVLTSDALNINANNATRQIYQNYVVPFRLVIRKYVVNIN
jgi:hypothetical protein